MSENYASKAIEIAEAEVGYLEKKSNSNLDSKTANAGSGNYTKYSRDLISSIGSPFAQGVAWCQIFVVWVFIKAFGLTTAKKLLGGWSAYTPTSAQYYKNMSQWFTSKPQVGDQIFFKNSTRICHTGIVYKVDSSKVYTIEGNTSGASGVIANGGGVCKKSYSLTNSSIAGYGRPKYDAEPSNSSTTSNSGSKYPYMAKTIGSLNCRKGAGTSYGIIKTFKSGEKLYVSKANSSGTWVYVNSTGWVSVKYTSAVSSWTGEVTANALNVRKGAGTSHDVIKTIKKNTSVKITQLNETATWGYDSVSKGWVSLKYIE